ncbi:MAG: universal stress protein [Betaproteobacteria bacterium HGW-Betaproteobacteria-1]|jgi:nucleotide-binding universal stress UspA family protein|nr:MAG: universal stress protein [Betaproteobacteria bacterium HGW-Betaproteobacteria-1]
MEQGSMEKTKQSSLPARRVLLATDLSARCDRALDRAAQLAKEWQAELLAVNVAESTQSPDMVLNWAYGADEANMQIVQQQLREDLVTAAVPVSVRVVKGEPAASIAEVANQDACDLLVTGMARSEPFGRFILGTTVEKLVRLTSQPVLVVRKRPHGPYRRVLVASDFSRASSLALHTALKLFPDNQIVLFHAVKQSLAELASDMPKQLQADAGFQARANEFYDVIGLSAPDRARITLHVEGGALEAVMTQYVRKHNIDLAVIGSRGQNSLMAGLLGSSASKLLHWLPCDTMIIGAQQSAD